MREAFEIGFDRAGIETVLQCEIDPWAQRVLRRHWPDTELVADVRDVQACGLQHPAMGGNGHHDASCGRALVPGHIDLIYGGFPCQPFSVAGKRAGDRDDRNLWPEFRRVVRELRPRWVVAENVPGLLSFDEGRFFGSILDDLGQLGFDGVAYAVLDAQHFGIPQRRRRVFVVAGPTRRAVEQILSLCESCGGNPPPRRAPGQDVAYALNASVRGTGDGHGNAWNSNYAIAVRTAQTGSNGWGVGVDGQAYTLDGASQAVLSPTLRENYRNNSNPITEASMLVANPIAASAGHHGHSSPRGDGADNLYVQDTAYALAARNAKGISLLESQDNFVVPSQGVRRLTPLECERLMGWPDDWTRWADDGSEISDSHRYRICGNGVVATVSEWLGRRIIAAEGAHDAARDAGGG